MSATPGREYLEFGVILNKRATTQYPFPNFISAGRKKITLPIRHFASTRTIPSYKWV